MHIVIIGGSGRTGKLVIEHALQKGNTVTALVRDPTCLDRASGLTTVQGTPMKIDDIEAAFAVRTPDAVVVTLNANRASDSPFAAIVAPPRLLADSNANAVTVMKKHGVRKIVTMAAFGAGDSFNEMNCLLKLVMRKTNMAHTYTDHDLVDQEMKRTGLDWVLVRPTMLKDGEAKPVKEFGNTGKGVAMFDSITRLSVARFIVDAVEKDTWNGKTPVISN